MPEKRRRNGDGSIRYRSDRNLWEVQITIGTDPMTGRQIRVSRNAKSEADAVRIKNELIAGRANGTIVVNDKITIGELVEIWFTTFQEPGQYETTRLVSRGLINNHIKPYIGPIAVQKVSRMQLQQYFNKLQSAGSVKHRNFQGEFTGKTKPLSHSVTKKIRAVLVAAFDYALKEKIITSNIVRETKLFKKNKPITTFFKKSEISVFINGTKKRRYHLAYRLLFETGLRRSELLGLAWDAIDFSNHHLEVTHVLVTFGKFVDLKDTTKTKAGTRLVPLHPETVQLLLLHMEKQKKEASHVKNWRNQHNLVFTQNDGSLVKPNEFSRGFKDAIHKLKLRPELSVHSTRRSFATMLLAAGISIADVMKIGGWSDTATLLECYAKSQEDEHGRAPDIMRAIIDTAQEKTASLPNEAVLQNTHPHDAD